MSVLEFAAALDGARTLAHVDEINRAFLGAVAAGTLGGEEAERIDAAIVETRQRVEDAAEPQAAGGRPPLLARDGRGCSARGRPRPMDRNAKVRIMHLARALMRRTEAGKAYGAISAKALAVLETLNSRPSTRQPLVTYTYECMNVWRACGRQTGGENSTPGR